MLLGYNLGPYVLCLSRVNVGYVWMSDVCTCYTCAFDVCGCLMLVVV